MPKPTRQPAEITAPNDVIACPIHPGVETPCGVCELAGLMAVRCDINDAPWVYAVYERQGFIRARSFAVLVFLARRRPTVKASPRATQAPTDH